jgi:hypothetical protein
MAVSISTTGTRTSATLSVPVTLTIGDLPTVGNDTTDSFYLPVIYKDFAPTPFVLTGQTVVSGAATFTPSAEDFARLRVGDVMSAVSAGTVSIPSPSTFTRTAKVYNGLDFIILTGSNSLPQDGDAISGTGIAGGATVVRVDTATRTVYLSAVNTESSLAASNVTITVTPVARIASLNTTTRLVTLNGNFAGTGTDVSGSLTFTPSGFNPVLYYLEAVHTATTVDRLSVALKVYPQTGALAYDANGTAYDVSTISSVGATPVGNFFINTDTYLTNARKPRVDPA